LIESRDSGLIGVMRDEVVRLVREGRTLEAERLLRADLDEAVRRHGQHSLPHAQVLFDLAALFVNMGAMDRAAEFMEEAASVRGRDDEARKARLMYLMNLGELLARAGKPERAETVLRRGLEERASFYGQAHAGYAYGAEALAEVLLARGRAPESLALAESAHAIFAAQNHERTPHALALEMIAIKAARGPTAPGVPAGATLSDAMLEAVAEGVRERAPVVPLEATLATLDELDGLMTGRPALMVARRNGLAFKANLARESGAHAPAIAAAERLIELLGDAPPRDAADADERLRVREGLALFLSDAGRTDEADAAYREAVALAARFGHAVLQSRVRRNFGLFLAERSEPAAAREMMTAALVLARSANDRDALGAALVAYGIFLQHQGEPAEAQRLLEEAAAVLPPAEPMLLYARAHLEALKRGGACDCARHMPGAIADSVKALVLRQLPPGLVGDLRVELQADAKPNVSVFLARQPTAEERQLLAQVIEHAVLEIQKRIRDEKTR
jgi:tetratricopeptide (TPR) repeat protein